MNAIVELHFLKHYKYNSFIKQSTIESSLMRKNSSIELVNTGDAGGLGILMQGKIEASFHS